MVAGRGSLQDYRHTGCNAGSSFSAGYQEIPSENYRVGDTLVYRLPDSRRLFVHTQCWLEKCDRPTVTVIFDHFADFKQCSTVV
jgi:hypothetical protein